MVTRDRARDWRELIPRLVCVPLQAQIKFTNFQIKNAKLDDEKRLKAKDKKNKCALVLN